MSHSTPSKFTRRAVLTGTTTGLAVASLPFGIASVATKPVQAAAKAACSTSLCASHHVELSHHMRQLLDAAYVDEAEKSKLLRTTTCPHCAVGIHPAEKAKPEFVAQAA